MPQDELVEPQATTLDPRVDFLAGTVAGAAGLVVGQPFDTVKVRFQSPQFAGRYSTTWGALAAIAREERVRGLFKGITSPMAGIAFINGIVFSSYGFFMKTLHPSGGNGISNGTDKGEDPALWQMGLAGAGSGVVASALTTPTELIKIRQQASRTPMSTTAVIRSILKQEGPKGLYRGFGVTALRELGYGPYFLAYEGICRLFRKINFTSPFQLSRAPHNTPHLVHPESLIEEAESEIASLSWPELMFAGGAAGAIAWAATFPFDVLKTRIQGDVTRKRSTWKVANEAIRQEGVKVMFAGLAPTLIRAIPTNMVIFLTFEAVTAAIR